MPKIKSKYVGKKYSKEKSIWLAMRSRCYNKLNQSYPNYGGRGITICDRWLHSFDNFFDDMGFKPIGLNIDRINNNKGYSKENCRWATYKQNANNTRRNIVIDVFGSKKTIEDISILTGLKVATILYRYHRNMPIEKIIEKQKLPNKTKNPIKHGTYYAYQTRLCRCDECKKAASVYKSKMYKLRKEEQK